MSATPTDLVADQDEYKSHEWEMCLWPDQWQSFDSQSQLEWQSVALNEGSKPSVPKGSGIYSLTVKPGIANQLECSYLMYVGKAINLRKRFNDYLTTERTNRPKIIRLLQKYKEYIEFCYSKISEAELDEVEEQLINSFIPPCNSKFTGKVGRARGAFK